MDQQKRLIKMFGHFLAPFQNFFYKTIGDIVTLPQSVFRLRQKRFDQILFIFYLIRSSCLIFMMASKFPENLLWKLDYTLHFIKNSPYLDELFMSCLVLMGIFIFIATQQMYSPAIEKNRPTWLYLHALAVESMDHYDRCRRSQAQVDALEKRKCQELLQDCRRPYWSNWFLSYYVRIRAKWTIWTGMEHVDKQKLARTSLPIGLECPLRLRLRLIQAIIVFEQCSTFYQVAAFILFVLCGLVYLPTFLSYSVLHFPLVLFDHVSIHYIFRLLAKSGIYTFYCMISFCLTAHKFAYFRRSFHGIIGRHRAAKLRSYSLRAQIWKRLNQFRCEHTQICAHLLQGNRQVFSRVLLCFLCTNLPSNIYFFIRLFLTEKSRALPLLDSLAIGIVFLGQTSVVVIVLVLLAHQSHSLHSFDRYLPAVQQILQGNARTLCKLQFDDLLGRLLRGPRYGITIGPFWVITYDKIFQILLGYIYYVLFAFNLQFQATVNNQRLLENLENQLNILEY